MIHYANELHAPGAAFVVPACFLIRPIIDLGSLPVMDALIEFHRHRDRLPPVEWVLPGGGRTLTPGVSWGRNPRGSGEPTTETR
jgi:hypothetical protein